MCLPPILGGMMKKIIGFVLALGLTSCAGGHQAIYPADTGPNGAPQRQLAAVHEYRMALGTDGFDHCFQTGADGFAYGEALSDDACPANGDVWIHHDWQMLQMQHHE